MKDLTIWHMPQNLGDKIIPESERGVEWLSAVAPNVGAVNKGEHYFLKDRATADRYAEQARGAGLVVDIPSS